MLSGFKLHKFQSKSTIELDWYYEDISGNWVSYSQSVSSDLEKSYVQFKNGGEFGCVKVKPHRVVVRTNTGSFREIKTNSKKSTPGRKVQRGLKPSERKFVIVIDAQYDFLNSKGALYVPRSERLIPRIDQFLRTLDNCAGVLYTFDTHYPSTYYNTEESKLFPIHCIDGSRGWSLAIDHGLVPRETTQWFLKKGQFSMWEEDATDVVIRPFPENENVPACETLKGKKIQFVQPVRESNRNEFFEMLKGDGINTVEVCGVATDVCVRAAILGLLRMGFKVIVDESMVAGISLDVHDVKCQSEFLSYSEFFIVKKTTDVLVMEMEANTSAK